MNLKTSQIPSKETNERDIESLNHYPPIADLIKEQSILIENTETVHRRRDLDSLG